MKKKWIASQIKDLLPSFPAENSRMKKKCFIALAACALVLLAEGCNNGFNDAVLVAMQNNAKQEPVAVESVTLNATTLSLAPGAKGKLTATVKPDNAGDKTVSWSSSDTSVATVAADGTVTAVSKGTATITARAGGKTAACAVTVHTHSYSNGKCTVCGFAKPSMPDGEIDDDGVLTKYTGSETAVVIPDGVTGIGNLAFYECESLASVEIPDGVTSIGNGAFYGCASLASVEIPGSVTSIGNFAFYGCTKLKEIQFNGTKAQWWQAIEGSSWLNVTCIFCTDGHIGVEEVPDYLTMSGTAVTGYADGLPANLVIPDGVTDIAWKSFSGCTSLASVAYGGTLAQWCAMYNDNCLMSYAKHVTVEGKDLKQAESIEIPDGVTRIGDNAFYDCESLKSVTIPDGVTRIGQYAFSGCTSLESVTIPGSVTSIGYEAFSGCASLASVTIPDGVTSIGGEAFRYCKSLESVTIPGSVESIGSSAFYYCTSLENVTIPGSVTSIGGEAFSGCTSLESVTIGNGVESIRSRAFYGCTDLASVTYDSTKDDWRNIEKGSSIFSNTNVTEITDKDGVTFTVDEYGNITE